jgi:dolichol kinase
MDFAIYLLMQRTWFLLNESKPQIQTFSRVEIVELKAEFVRKSIHFLIALSPFMAEVNKPVTVSILVIGTLAYSYMEYLRLSGVKIPVISSLTSLSSRPRDIGHFVIGPVTLGLGALLALVFFPSPAAAIAIYALAFGDGFASLVGMFFGSNRPAFLHGKSVEGSLACFTAVLISTYGISGNFRVAVIAAITAMTVEALSFGDYDNLVLPITVGLAVQYVSFG